MRALRRGAGIPYSDKRCHKSVRVEKNAKLHKRHGYHQDEDMIFDNIKLIVKSIPSNDKVKSDWHQYAGLGGFNERSDKESY